MTRNDFFRKILTDTRRFDGDFTFDRQSVRDLSETYINTFIEIMSGRHITPEYYTFIRCAVYRIATAIVTGMPMQSGLTDVVNEAIRRTHTECVEAFPAEMSEDSARLKSSQIIVEAKEEFERTPAENQPKYFRWALYALVITPLVQITCSMAWDTAQPMAAQQFQIFQQAMCVLREKYVSF